MMNATIEADRSLRIGELSRRTGVSSELLRAWERRYNLFTPARTPGGYRLYGDEDVRRAERMRSHIDAGLSAAEAAKVTGADFSSALEPEPPDASIPQQFGDELERALDRLDDAAAHAALDWLFSRFATETVLRDVVLPYMRGLGERWERGEEVIAAEHFASALLRGRLLGLARGWGAGGGPLAMLACVPGDQHDIGLICFGLALRGHGWRISFLGADTPLETIVAAGELLSPALLVVAASVEERAVAAAPALSKLARTTQMAIGGSGTDGALAKGIGAQHLPDDPMTSAALVFAR
jgi:MerR family transcriptional regulator, light-induced transcriptional regulator